MVLTQQLGTWHVAYLEAKYSKLRLDSCFLEEEFSEWSISKVETKAEDMEGYKP